MFSWLLFIQRKYSQNYGIRKMPRGHANKKEDVL